MVAIGSGQYRHGHHIQYWQMHLQIYRRTAAAPFLIIHKCQPDLASYTFLPAADALLVPVRQQQLTAVIKLLIKK